MSCSICKNPINEQNAPIIAMGGLGNPRCICEECAAKLEVMSSSMDATEIKSAVSEVAELMSNNDSEDPIAHNAVKALLVEATVRAKSIEEGTFDELFEENNSSSEELDEIPEELLETEEDRLLDKQDEIKNQKLDKIFNWIALGIFAAAVVGMVLFFVLR